MKELFSGGKMDNLTQEERTKIAKEELNKEPIETIGQVALLKMADLCISTGAENAEQTVEATLQGKRYACSMVVTWKEIKE
jgi:hypothetical protein